MVESTFSVRPVGRLKGKLIHSWPVCRQSERYLEAAHVQIGLTSNSVRLKEKLKKKSATTLTFSYKIL